METFKVLKHKHNTSYGRIIEVIDLDQPETTYFELVKSIVPELFSSDATMEILESEYDNDSNVTDRLNDYELSEYALVPIEKAIEMLSR